MTLPFALPLVGAPLVTLLPRRGKPRPPCLFPSSTSGLRPSTGGPSSVSSGRVTLDRGPSAFGTISTKDLVPGSPPLRGRRGEAGGRGVDDNRFGWTSFPGPLALGLYVRSGSSYPYTHPRRPAVLVSLWSPSSTPLLWHAGLDFYPSLSREVLPYRSNVVVSLILPTPPSTPSALTSRDRVQKSWVPFRLITDSVRQALDSEDPPRPVPP